MDTMSVDVNGVDIAYEIHVSRADNNNDGDDEDEDEIPQRDPPNFIVLVNGLADTKESWSLQIPALLQTGCNVLTFDNRGIGASSKPDGPYTAEEMAADVMGLVDALEIPKPFHLLGVSMGGMIAQAYAIQRPQDLATLILACTYSHPGPFCSRMFSLWADMAEEMSVGHVMRDVVLWAFTPEFFEPINQPALDEIEQLIENVDMDTNHYLSQLNVIRTFDSNPDLDSIHVPTLVLAGEEDILIPVSLSKELHKYLPNSQWATVRGGHGCMWEYPESFNAVVVDFIQTTEIDHPDVLHR
jgi:3-oxoadipate enol-lactonase